MNQLICKKRLTKQDKETAILLGLVELFIKTGSPVGSNSLKDKGFDYMSSATIRNYFNKLEKKGLVTQQHSSGGRIPTALAYRMFIDTIIDKVTIDKKEYENIEKKLKKEPKEITDYLHHSAEFLSNLSNCSVFQSNPRFDQDFIRTIKLIWLDKNKILCVIITDLGLIKTETIYSQKEIQQEDISSIEQFILWKMNRLDKPKVENRSLDSLSQYFYNEIMVRYVASFSNYSTEEIYKTGLSKLLNFEEFKDPEILAESLSLFENMDPVQHILKVCCKNNEITCFTAQELKNIGATTTHCSIIAIPYYINQVPVGATMLIGPIRLNYKHLFGVLKAYSKVISESLTNSVYKFKIAFRKNNFSEKKEKLSKFNRSILLEDKSCN